MFLQELHLGLKVTQFSFSSLCHLEHTLRNPLLSLTEPNTWVKILHNRKMFPQSLLFTWATSRLKMHSILESSSSCLRLTDNSLILSRLWRRALSLDWTWALFSRLSCCFSRSATSFRAASWKIEKSKRSNNVFKNLSGGFKLSLTHSSRWNRPFHPVSWETSQKLHGVWSKPLFRPQCFQKCCSAAGPEEEPARI